MLIQLIIIQAVTFVALIFVLRVLFYRQLNSALARLNRLHQENLAREEELKAELEKLNQARERELASAKEQAGRIIKDAKQNAEKLSVDISEQAKEQAKKVFEQSKSRIVSLENELNDRYQEMAVDLSVQMLEAAFTAQGKENLQQELLRELIQEIKGVDKARFTVKTDNVKITSACPLDASSLAEIRAIICEKLDAQARVEEAVDPGIIAGFVIEIGAFIIDASLRNKLRKVIPYLKAQK